MARLLTRDSPCSEFPGALVAESSSGAEPLPGCMRYLRRNSSNLWTGPSSIQTGFLRKGTVGMTIAIGASALNHHTRRIAADAELMRRALSMSQVIAGSRIFVRSLDPEKRLDVNHVARPQVREVVLHQRRKLQQALVTVPARP